jgi:radical SAM superfamily enzyme YgiQ (UPF0313 family)
MNITLINLSRTLSSDGSRLISALLKRAGHHVTNIYLSRASSAIYETDEFRQLHEILRVTDLVMVGVYSSYVSRAILVTEFIHSAYPGLKIIWGGPHCISVPELSLRHADGICFSEGDQAVVEMVNNMACGLDYLNTPNMAFNSNGTHVINQSLPPFSDLDSLPYYDYDLKNQFLLDQGIVPVTRDIIRKRHANYPYNKPTYFFLTSRGCPNECSYCNNSRYINLFGHNSLRFMSVDRIISELEYTFQQLDFFEMLFFSDDDFFARPLKQIEDLALKYKQKIGLPFIINSSANTYHKEKMELLLDAGLKCIQMGVQSGSQRIIDEVFTRNIKVTKTRQAISQIAPCHETRGLDLLLDFIIDNPYETRDDVMATYNYLVGLPRHAMVNIFYLAFLPGTPIYERALKDGYIEPYDEESSTFKFSSREGIRVRYQQNYEMLLVLIVRRWRLRCLDNQFRLPRQAPEWVFRFLGSSPMRAIASIFPESFFRYLCQKLQ